MKTLRRILLKPKVVVSAIIALLVTLVLGQLLGSSSSGTPARAGLPAALGVPLTGALGWCALGLAILMSVQLLLAILTLAERDFRRACRHRGPASRAAFTVPFRSGLEAQMRSAGYLRVGQTGSETRYVRSIWGYAGPTFLHMGMLVVVVSALLVALTTSAGSLVLSEGEIAPSGTVLANARQGLLANTPTLDASLRLEALDVSYWETGEPRSIAGVYTLMRPGDSRTLKVTTNQPLVVDRWRISQDVQVGYIYVVELSTAGASVEQRVILPLPASASEPAYADEVLANGDLLRAKVQYTAEASEAIPMVTLRLVRDGVILGQSDFAVESDGRVGDVDISVVAASRWGVVVLERSYGMSGVFAGFFLILLGAILIYSATPREVTLTRHDDGTVTADWHAVRFARLYASEERLLREAAGGEREGGSD